MPSPSTKRKFRMGLELVTIKLILDFLFLQSLLGCLTSPTILSRDHQSAITLLYINFLPTAVLLQKSKIQAHFCLRILRNPKPQNPVPKNLKSQKPQILFLLKVKIKYQKEMKHDKIEQSIIPQDKTQSQTPVIANPSRAMEPIRPFSSCL